MEGPNPSRHALVAALYDELALLEECPQETRAIVKKVNGLLQQLQQLEPAMGVWAEIDRFADLESPWGSDSEPDPSDRGDFPPELGDLEEWVLDEAVGSDEAIALTVSWDERRRECLLEELLQREGEIDSS